MAFFSRFSTVTMDLENVLYISYLVPVARMRQLVPDVLSIASDEDDRAYVSFVAMKCRRVHLSGFRWPRFEYDQLNLRTYVIDPETGNPAVYFFQSGVSLGIVPVLTRIMSIPWEKILFNLDISLLPIYRGSGHWLGEVTFEIESRADGELQESVVCHLTGPMMGFMGPEGKLRSFRISHRSLEVQSAVLNSIQFSLPVEKGLTTESELKNPDSVLMVPKAKFTVYLPPHLVSERG